MYCQKAAGLSGWQRLSQLPTNNSPMDITTVTAVTAPLILGADGFYRTQFLTHHCNRSTKHIATANLKPI